MPTALIDTDILSLFLRGEPTVVARFQAYTAVHEQISFSLITYYEILSGLRHRDAQRQLTAFLEFAGQCRIAPLTTRSVEIAADMYAATRAQGTPVDDIDLLIAGQALAYDWVLVPHNRNHCERITG